MAEDPFCEHGGLPQSMCGHCLASRYRQRLVGGIELLGPPEGVYERWARDIRAWDAAGRQMVAQRYAIPWADLHKIAFPPEHDWAELHEKAAVHGYGPWIISEFHGTCRGCGLRWVPGEMIRFSEDEDSWVCDGCGSQDPGVT